MIQFLLLIVIIVFREPLFSLVIQENYIMMHLLITFFIVSTALTITVHAWMTFPHTLSVQKTLIGALFLSIAFFEILHAFTHPGMPISIDGDLSYFSTWFYMISRLSLAFGLLIALLTKERTVQKSYRWILYSLAITYNIIWFSLIFNPNPLLPSVMTEGIGPTTFKNSLQSIAFLTQITCFVYLTYLIKSSRKNRDKHIMMLTASFYLMMSDLTFMLFTRIDDMINFLGHLFEFVGIYYLLKAIYYTSIEEHFYELSENRERLKNSQSYLQTITSQIGEGILLINNEQKIIFVNPMGATLLKWDARDLYNKNFRLILPEGKTFFSWTNGTKKVIQSQFKRKDNSIISVSYVMTPFIQNGAHKGAILVFRDISELVQQRKHIAQLAYYDERTELSNYKHFQQQVDKMLQTRPNQQKALFMLDIERFASINESLGPEIGNLILKKIANRLKGTLSDQLLIGTMREKQFMVFSNNIGEEKEVMQLHHEIQETFSKPFLINHLQLTISAKVGIALYPTHGARATELIKNAQTAAYYIENELNHVTIFDPMMNEQRLEKLTLENDLYRALEKDELYLEYQPQVNIKTGEICSVETLIRWQHPENGFISPGKFIPIAEDTGLIVPIGEWILREACTQLKKWHEQGFTHLTVAVNISSRQFYQEDLLATIQDILEETALSPTFLELEITESVTLNVEHAKEILQGFKKLGISIAMDDFGTGYSSLHYLNQFPIDRLKIDRSFVKDIQTNSHNAALCTMITTIGKHLNMEVIAEGIEMPDQLSFLAAHDCYHIQGFLFSKPLQAKQFIAEYALIEKQVKDYQTTLTSLPSKV